MNKLNISMLIIATFGFGCSDGLISAPTTGELKAPDYSYEIDTWGSNSEVYEFTPKSDSRKTCVMLMLDNGRAMGLQCFDKPAK